MKILGLDLGDRHVGVAILDTEAPVALPLPALPNNRFFIKKLLEVIVSKNIEEIVIGLPLGLAGHDSAQTGKVRTSTAHIAEVTGLPTYLEDERFTTRQASQLLAGTSDLPPHHLDSVSAQLILESWWNKQKS